MTARWQAEGPKVLFVCAADISASKLLSAQVRALEEEGFRVHIACSDGPYARALISDGYTVQMVPILNRARPGSNLRTVLALYRLIRRERYHVVHVHMISAAFLGRIAAWLAGTPLILYTFRGFAFYSGSSWALKVFNLAIERLCTPMTDFFFVQAEGNRRRGIEAGVIPASRSMTIGNGVRVAEFLATPEDDRAAGARSELGLPREAIVLGYVGRLVREKGLEELVKAFSGVVGRHPSVFLLIVGEALPSDMDVKRNLLDLIRREGIQEWVVFAGYRDDMPRMYRAMDVFVLPSYREGAPRSIMEAMASGKPVVATDIAGCRDQVVDGITGMLVRPGDAGALERALFRMMEDPNLRKRMGEAGRSRALELFDERVVCERIVRSYIQLLGTSNGVAAAIQPPQWCVEEAHVPTEARPLGRAVKQAMDYGGSVIGLIVLSPILLLTALAIKADSRGPVLYRQVREGKGSRPFRIIKFRTMVDGADRQGLEIRKNDDRITRVGRFLRLTSIDELPQLLNVLRGEMSLVGPRPLLPGTTRPEESRRLDMKPGITSYPALFGRHALDWEERMPLDIWYVDHWSLRLDLRIILHTIPIVFAARNVYDSKGGSHLRGEGGKMGLGEPS